MVGRLDLSKKLANQLTKSAYSDSKRMSSDGTDKKIGELSHKETQRPDKRLLAKALDKDKQRLSSDDKGIKNKWARKDSNLRPMDYESRVLPLSGYILRTYKSILGQKRDLQVVNK